MRTDAGVILETERLLLRKLSPADVDALLAILGDPNTMLHFPRPFEREMVVDSRQLVRAIRSSTMRYDHSARAGS